HCFFWPCADTPPRRLQKCLHCEDDPERLLGRWIRCCKQGEIVPDSAREKSLSAREHEHKGCLASASIGAARGYGLRLVLTGRCARGYLDGRASAVSRKRQRRAHDTVAGVSG